MFSLAVTIISIPPGLVWGFMFAMQHDDYHHLWVLSLIRDG